VRKKKKQKEVGHRNSGGKAGVAKRVFPWGGVWGEGQTIDRESKRDPKKGGFNGVSILCPQKRKRVKQGRGQEGMWERVKNLSKKKKKGGAGRGDKKG